MSDDDGMVTITYVTREQVCGWVIDGLKGTAYCELTPEEFWALDPDEFYDHDRWWNLRDLWLMTRPLGEGATRE